ncbi:MAG TPA: tripartite tricarboxylate transporter substrate binding protein [Burkholderiales bacterium]|nr:tripartite tricarboxylate transporter substrate binding protein [Burkholderiales bacterium]
MKAFALNLAATVLFAIAASATAQEYPSKPIRIVASEPGGGGDFLARLIGQGLTANLGQPVVVENRGGGVIAGDLVARSAPDGYTVLLYGNTLWLLPLMRSRIPYDPFRDFLPVTLVARAVNVLVVHPAVPARTVKELIAVARARPGELNYASAAPGTSNHLAAELFKYMAKVNIVRVGFRGSTSALTSVMSGQTHLMFATAAGVTPHLKSEKVRALAVSSREPSPLFPGLPTVAASGVPGFETVSMHGVFVPARTPPPIVARLNQEIARVLHRPDLKSRFDTAGVEPVGNSPEAFAAVMKDEVTRMEKVIRSAGIREE